jgi:predicted esterase
MTRLLLFLFAGILPFPGLRQAVWFSECSVKKQNAKAQIREEIIKESTGGHRAFAFHFIFSLATPDGLIPVNELNDTLVVLKNGNDTLNIYIKVPEKKPAIGTMVVLPGWKLPVLDWCTKTSLCRKALRQGYILVMPEMAKSVYQYEIYPETRMDWQMYATRKWFIDTLVPYFQHQYRLLLPGQRNFLLGLSTGARGVALLCLDCPEIFKKGAGLSGDYDQTRMPADALMTGFYGPIGTHRLRWTGKDNVVYRCRELKVPLYLGHGRADKIVPCSQTLQLADSLNKYMPSLVKCHIADTAGHDYGYWDSEVDNVLEFFQDKPLRQAVPKAE